MAITFSDDCLGIAIVDNHSCFGCKLRLSSREAKQVRDELLRRYPLGDTVGYVPRADGGIPDHMLPPIPPPQAALSLEVGKWYLRRDGRKVKIVGANVPIYPRYERYPFVDHYGTTYAPNGKFCWDPSDRPADLIAETTAPEEESATSADARPLAVGDTVRLKSGGPVMTVGQVAVEGIVHCEWFSGFDSLWNEFPAAALVRAKP